MVNKELNIPLYIQIYKDLKQNIIHGKYSSDEYLPSERELSNYYGVERATLRRSLKLLVNDKLLLKMPGMGTKVIYNKAENGLKYNNCGNSIAFILPHDSMDKITQPFISKIFYYMEEEYRKLDYNLFYINLRSDDNLPEFILNKGVKGIVWVSHIEDAFVYRAKELGIPAIIISNYIQGVTSILIDNRRGSFEAVDYLISSGHKRIAHISGKRGYLNTSERLEGYKSALNASKIPFNKGLVREGDWTFESGYENMIDLIDNGQGPTAVFAANDMMAMGAMKAIMEKGMRIPQDMVIVGFDNIEQSKYTNPPLSTIGAETKLIAKQATKCLNNIIVEDESQPFKIIIPTEFIKRGTVK